MFILSGIFYVIMALVASVEMLAAYLMRAFGTMLISKKLGLSGSWMGFVPFLDLYQLGKIADEDRKRYHPEKEPTNWRKWVITSYVAILVLYIVLIITAVVAVVAISLTAAEDGALGTIGILSLVLLGAAYFLLLAVAIVYSVIVYIVYYKVFHVMADEHAVWMLILSMLFTLAFPIILLVLGISKKFPLKEPACVVCGGENGTDGQIVHTSFEEKDPNEQPAVEEPAVTEAEGSDEDSKKPLVEEAIEVPAEEVVEVLEEEVAEKDVEAPAEEVVELPVTDEQGADAAE